MQFKYPEILYFLALGIIPIIVHLFQLQKFVKTPFTNVAFLQKLAIQTRKSSRIKKWLILAIRLLLFFAIIFAFSQPYFGQKKATQKQHIFLYLDNSLSTNAKGEKGNILAVSIQEILENISKNSTYSLLTNTHFYKKITASELKNTLLKTKKTASKTTITDVLLKFNNQKTNKINSLDKAILISDFQNVYKKEFTNVNQPISLIQTLPTLKNNLSIDSVFIQSKNDTNFTLQIVIKNQGEEKINIPIAIFSKKKLISKQSFSIKKNTKKNILFSLQNTSDFLGRIQLNFNDTFSFDNSFYFTLNLTKKTNVLSIGKTAHFLSKIYTKNSFNFTSSNVKNSNYNTIPKQQLIILNEVEKTPLSLQKSLATFSKNGGHLVIIPNEKLDLNNYQQLFTRLQIGNLKPKKTQSLKITKIHYNHPFFKDVFSKKVRNFQYPTAKINYPTAFKNSSTLVSFENNSGFIKQVNTLNSKIYWFASPLNLTNNNFINSPLVVPVFYNFGKQSIHFSKLFYRIGTQNKIDVTTELENDAVLSIQNNDANFIPLQETHQNKVTLTTKNTPVIAGNFFITKKTDTLKSVAFNYPKEESSLLFLNAPQLLKENKNITITTSVKEVLQEINQKNKVQWLWKWFLTLAIVSLLIEILILKFFKP